MKKEEIFNLVAPIHIYLNADLLYEKEAKEAFKALKKIQHNERVICYFGKGVEVFNERSVKNVDEKVFWRVYNQLFEEIVKDVFPQWRTDYDTHGAKCFNFDGLILLDGDAYDCFPFYLDNEALMERLMDLKSIA